MPPAPEFDEDEKLRLLQMSLHEEAAYSQGFRIVAGVDEAGRGPLAGPVIAAVCVLPRGLLIPQVNDSKLLSPSLRKSLFQILINDPRIRYAVGAVEHDEIDRLNIYRATLKAMHEAVDRLEDCRPDCLLVDGMKLEHPDRFSVKIVKGDRLSQSIAAASIIAKETRDLLMEDFDRRWPVYGFAWHKGYGTPGHLEALKRYGPCPIHRRSFEPVKTMCSETSGSIHRP